MAGVQQAPVQSQQHVQLAETARLEAEELLARQEAEKQLSQDRIRQTYSNHRRRYLWWRLRSPDPTRQWLLLWFLHQQRPQLATPFSVSYLPLLEVVGHLHRIIVDAAHLWEADAEAEFMELDSAEAVEETSLVVETVEVDEATGGYEAAYHLIEDYLKEIEEGVDRVPAERLTSEERELEEGSVAVLPDKRERGIYMLIVFLVLGTGKITPFSQLPGLEKTKSNLKDSETKSEREWRKQEYEAGWDEVEDEFAGVGPGEE
ncbi:hypothetical protein RUND412_006836 [Rhizina undulata]